MDSNFLHWMISQSGIALVAAFALFYLDNTYRQMKIEREREQRMMQRWQYDAVNSARPATEPKKPQANRCAYCGCKANGDNCASCGAPAH